MKSTKLLLIVALTMTMAFGDAMVNYCQAENNVITEVMKKKKKKKSKKKSKKPKIDKETTRAVVGYKSLVHEKTPEEIKHEQDSLAQVRAEFLANDKVYTAVEVKPEFPGGEVAMYEYINEHLRYPDDAFDMGIQGSVDVHFIVRKDGTITDAEAPVGAWQSLKDEAVRIVQNMPNWTPGQIDGQPVSYRHRVRITFLKTGNLSGY